MTEAEFLEEFEAELYTTFGIEREKSPYKTGNLRYNGIQIMKTPRGYRIWVDLSIAPYSQFLDTKPKIQREHPEGWFNEIAMGIINKIMKKYNKNQEKSKGREEKLEDFVSNFVNDDDEGG